MHVFPEAIYSVCIQVFEGTQLREQKKANRKEYLA